MDTERLLPNPFRTVPSWVVHNLDSSFRSTTAGSASIRTERHILRLPSFSFLGIRNEPVTGIPANFTAALSIDVGWSNPRDHMYDYPRGPDPNMRIPSHSQFKAARGTPFRLRPESLL
ncbi:hypothetical protein APHAL10511_004601 [Amanita phalloides]|nr:hypothetical protein APHAL10511_004601 [Amanita phalloides]